jgi:hypothetical protein
MKMPIRFHWAGPRSGLSLLTVYVTICPNLGFVVDLFSK